METLQYRGDETIRPRHAEFSENPININARPSDKRSPNYILLFPRRLAQQHNRRPRVALARHRKLPRRAAFAPRTHPDAVEQLLRYSASSAVNSSHLPLTVVSPSPISIDSSCPICKIKPVN